LPFACFITLALILFHTCGLGYLTSNPRPRVAGRGLQLDPWASSTVRAARSGTANKLQWDDARLHERQERGQAVTRVIQSIGIRLGRIFGGRREILFRRGGRLRPTENRWPSFVQRRSSAWRTGVTAPLGPLFLFSPNKFRGTKAKPPRTTGFFGGI
jgi:hypothetical protein